MSRVLTTTTYGVLGLLAVRPYSTYELAKAMGLSVGRVWPRAESKLFEEPKKLVEHGYARSREETVGRRRRTVYSITAAGRRALAAWLAEPGDGPVLEFEGLVKLMFADHGSRADALETIASSGLSCRRSRICRAPLQRRAIDGITMRAKTIIGLPRSWAWSAPTPAAQTSAWALVLLAEHGDLLVTGLRRPPPGSRWRRLVASLTMGATLVFTLAEDRAGPRVGVELHAHRHHVVRRPLCHALNLLDDMDGLAAGVAIVATAFLAALLGPSLGSMLVGLLIGADRRARRVPLLEPSTGRRCSWATAGACSSARAGWRLAGPDLQRAASPSSAPRCWLC